MLTRFAAMALALCAPQTALAQSTAPVESNVPARQAETLHVALETGKGRIVLALDKAKAPVTVANFLHYVESGKLDDESFYRAMPYGSGGLIQGGIRSDARKLADPIAHEPTSETGLKHVAGAISMANFGPGTAQSDFFIVANDIPAFDAHFAVFGRVVEGMDVVKAILSSPVSPMKGEGSMKGQMLEPPIMILDAELLRD